MALTGTFLADFASFTDACAKAELSLKGFEGGAGKVETQLNRVGDSLSGVKIVQQATVAAEAVDRIGGISKLTEAELQRLGAIAQEAAAKMVLMGVTVPPAIQAIGDAAKKAAGGTDELGKSWILRIAEGELLRDAVREVINVMKEMVAFLPELAMKGAVVGDVEESFKHLAAGAGLAADVLLGTLRAGTHGTIGDFELMQRANKDLAAGLNLTDAQFGLLAQGAFALAKATGGDAKDALDKMSDAMVTGRTKAIALITGKIDLKAAEEAYAQSLGGTADQLTTEQKLYADQQAILKAVEGGLHRVGEQHDSLKDKVEQGKVSWENFKDELGKSIAQSPVIATAFDSIKRSLAAAFGPDQAQQIATITHDIEAFAIVMADLGIGGVAVGEALNKIWNGIAVVVLAAETQVAGFFDLFAEGLAIAAQDAARLHLISPAAAAEIVDVRTQLRGITADLAAQTVEAGKAALGNSDMQRSLEKAGGALFVMRDEMIAAQSTTVAHTAATLGHAGATDKDTDALGMSKAAAKAYAEAIANLDAVGTTWQETLAGVDAGLVADAKTMLAAGASAKDLEIAWGLLPAVLKAIEASIKDDADALRLSDKITADSAINWATYFRDVASLGADSVAKLKAGTQAWLDDEIAKHVLAKTDTADFYAFVYAEAAVKDAKIEQSALQGDVHSRAHFQLLADQAKIAYEFAQAHADQYSADWIAKLDEMARAAQRAADTFGTSFDEAGRKVVKAGADTAAAFTGVFVKPVFASIDAASQALFDFYAQFSNAIGTPHVGAVGIQTSMGSGAHVIVPGLQTRDGGGPVAAGQSVLIGLNRQPEIFTPGASGFVTPLGAGGGSVTVHNYFTIVDTAENLARKSADLVLQTVMQASKIGAH